MGFTLTGSITHATTCVSPTAISIWHDFSGEQSELIIRTQQTLNACM